MTQNHSSQSLPPWSTATIEAYTTCPYRYYRLQVARDIELPDNPATNISRQLHEAFANRLAEGVPLPDKFARFERMLQKYLDMPGDKAVNLSLAVDNKMQPCGYDVAWARAVVDFCISKDNQAVLVSWRTGNYEPSDQLRLSAVLYFANHPECEILHTRVLWLRNRKFEKETYTRADIRNLWTLFVEPYKKWAASHKHGTWRQTPCGLCNKYCGIKDCGYCLS